MSELYMQGMIAGSILGIVVTHIAMKMMFNKFPWEVENGW